MAARAYGDANLNDGQDNGSDYANYKPRRRLTRYNLFDQTQAKHYVFKAFTRESLNEISRKSRIASSASSSSNKNKNFQAPNNNNSKPVKSTEPDPCLASGQQLPPALLRQLPAELVGRPIEDVDPYYADKEVSSSVETDKELIN